MTAVLSLPQHARLLLITAERIGDALFCTPGIALLKKQRPDLHIDLLAFHKNAAYVFEHNPDIDTVHINHRNTIIRKIAAKYPLVLNLTYEFQSYLKKLPSPLISIEKPDRTMHRAEQVLRFIQSQLNCIVTNEDRRYHLYPQIKDTLNVKKLLAQRGIDPDHDILVGCQLGCHRVARRSWKFWSRTRHQHRKVWPLERYIDLAKRLHLSHPNVRFVLTGSPQEMFLATAFLREVPSAYSLIGQTSLFELAALMDYINVLLTHDTGTLHIACARQTPLVTLFGPTALAFTGPYPLRDDMTILAKSNMAEISIDEVYSALLPHLQ